MTTRHKLKLGLALSLLLGAVPLALPQPQDPNMPPPGVDVQTRGPIHEAFAQPNDPTPGAGILVPKQPPQPINELPPEQRPDKETTQWIPGYWAWDADRNDFLWISGVYRDPPPGRRFVPGHWVQSTDGFRWVAGFWNAEQQQELVYAPEPPAALDANGPSMPAPDANSVYVPGYWVYQNTTYAWRAGYYAPHRHGRIWVASRYVWTPSGYLFVNGYWDYPLEDRGIVFAPVYFGRPYWSDPYWSYRPSFVVSLGGVTDSFFWRRGSAHFYFGDFYGGVYVGVGYRPWWECRYDPLFSYYRWNHREDPHWATNHQRVYADRMAGRAPLPPRTLVVNNTTIINNTTVNNTTYNKMVAPISTVNTVNNTNVKMVANTPAQIATQQANAASIRSVSALRTGAEAATKSTSPTKIGSAPTTTTVAQPFKLPASPAVSTQNLTPSGTGTASPKVTNTVTPIPGKQPVTGAFSPPTTPTPGIAQPIPKTTFAPPTTTVQPVPKATTGPTFVPGPTAQPIPKIAQPFIQSPPPTIQQPSPPPPPPPTIRSTPPPPPRTPPPPPPSSKDSKTKEKGPGGN